MPQPLTPGRELMNRIRAGFILQNTTFTAWCAAHGIEHTAARQAIHGTWAGPRGRQLRAQILKAAGVQEAA